MVSENGSEFKREFTTFIKDFDIKSVLKKLKPTKDSSNRGGAPSNIKYSCYQRF